ncbi:hypothetical protein [Streptomyces sp. NPDC050534]|uniref:hypothetical protein n=1 Tax=Streptomyces sp. NPDC050534 TaxID=3365625 RepID=UPI0037B6ED04
MSITAYLPRLSSAARPTRRHRASDEVKRLRAKNRKLSEWKAQADAYFERLRADRQAVYASLQFAEHARQAAEQIVVEQERQIRDLKRQLGEAKRRLEIGVLAEAAAAETQELDVSSLRERFAEGPVYALHQSPMARRKPDHVPAWVKDQPDPAA